jgi:hypothetical protein
MLPQFGVLYIEGTIGVIYDTNMFIIQGHKITTFRTTKLGLMTVSKTMHKNDTENYVNVS